MAPIIAAALKEDIGARDLTTWALIPKTQSAKGDLVVREEGVVAGLQVAEWTFNQLEPKIRFKPAVKDGDVVHPDKVVAYIEGPARGILTAERTALNFMGRLSGIATLTWRFVERVGRYPVEILATRKTTPTLRLLEKYAVLQGRGVAHRMGLYDQVLIKDNHLQLLAARIRAGEPLGPSHRISAIEEAVREVRARLPGKSVEVEVTTLQEFRQALSSKADLILLDNMRYPEIQEAVRLRNALLRSVPRYTGKGYRPLLEVSGGITLESVESLAAAGVDRISIGGLTHSAPALNVALQLVG